MLSVPPRRRCITLRNSGLSFRRAKYGTSGVEFCGTIFAIVLPRSPDMNLPHLAAFRTQFTSVVVKFANRYRLNVTQRVTKRGLINCWRGSCSAPQLGAGAAGAL